MKQIARSRPPGRDLTGLSARALENDLGTVSIDETTPRGATASETNDSVMVPFFCGSTPSWAIPLAEDEFQAVDYWRAICDISRYNTGRLIVNVKTPGPAGAYLSVEAGGFALSWGRLLGDFGVEVDIASILLTGWKSLDNDSRTDGVLRLIGGGGDGVTLAEFGNIYLELRRDSGVTETLDEIGI